jgi:parvulin-like peptidyl-prolyl isomerase
MRKFLSLVIALIVAALPLAGLCEAAAAPEETAAATEAAPAAEETQQGQGAEAQEAAETEPAEAIDPNKVVASVDGDEILYREVDGYYQSMASQYSAYIDLSQDGMRSMLMDQALNYAIQIRLMQHKAAELGLDALTEEQIAQIDESAQTLYDSMISTYAGYYAQSGVDEDQAKADAEAFLESYDYTLDKLKEQYRTTEILKRVQAHVTDAISVSDEDVQASYDGKVADQKASYDADVSAYGMAQLYGTAIYYTPENVRTVKHILIKPETIDEINTLKQKIAAEETAEADKAEAQTQLDKLMDEAMVKVNEVMDKVNSGEDFQGLIDAYGEDPGMQAGSQNAEIGYYVCEGAPYDPAFLEAALALEKAGDVSGPVLGSYGYHIIRYESDVPSGPVDFDLVKGAIGEELLSGKKDEAFTAAIAEWEAAATIERFE